MGKKLQWLFTMVTLIGLLNTSMIFGLGVGDGFVDFSLEDPHGMKYSRTYMEGKITLVILQSRTTLQTAIDCKTELKKLVQENQKVQMISIMDLRKRPPLIPKSALKAKISAQDTTSNEIPFLLDWNGELTKALEGEDNKCKVLIVEPALKVVYNQEYKKAAIDSEIKPLLAELSGGQK